MFPAYGSAQQGSERPPEDPPDKRANEPSYHSYPVETPKKRSYADEARIKMDRKKVCLSQ